jgi:hypothetical protein
LPSASAASSAQRDSAKPAAPSLSPAAADYADTARRIREASLASDGAFRKLSYLTDRIGARLSGSAALERAVTWAKDTLIADGTSTSRWNRCAYRIGFGARNRRRS